MKFSTINNNTCELSPLHVPEMEYERIALATTISGEYTFFAAIFDEGYFIYLFLNRNIITKRTDKTKHDFPVFYELMQKLIYEDIKVAVIHDSAEALDELQVYERE